MADEAPKGDSKTAGSTAAGKSPDSTPAAPAAPEFPRERLLGEDGATIVGHPAHVIAAALAGDEQEMYTRTDIRKKVSEFLNEPASLSTDDDSTPED